MHRGWKSSVRHAESEEKASDRLDSNIPLDQEDSTICLKSSKSLALPCEEELVADVEPEDLLVVNSSWHAGDSSHVSSLEHSDNIAKDDGSKPFLSAQTKESIVHSVPIKIRESKYGQTTKTKPIETKSMDAPDVKTEACASGSGANKKKFLKLRALFENKA